MRYIYTCISGNRIKSQEEVQQTRKYKKSLELAEIFKADDVVIDICSTWNRDKPNLKKILSKLYIGSTYLNCKCKYNTFLSVCQVLFKKNCTFVENSF